MSLQSLFRKKSIADIQAEGKSGHLKRTLTAANLVSLGVGAIIGAGIFVMTGTAAAEHAGPAIVLSFILAGIACGFAALCYGELASMLPVSGSAYTYSYATLGEVVAWGMALLLLLEYGISAATVAVGWSGYMLSFLKDFDIYIPLGFTTAYGEQVPFSYIMSQWLTIDGMPDLKQVPAEFTTLFWKEVTVGAETVKGFPAEWSTKMLEKVTLVAEGAKQKYYLLPEGFVSNAAKQITLDNGTSAQGFTVDQMRQLLVTYAEGDRILGIMNLPGFLIVLLITCLLVIGVHESAKVNNIIVIVKSAVIIGFAIIGAFYVDSSNWQPFIPENTGSWGVFGYSGILAAAGVIFFAYIGFEAVSTAAQEAKNPQKDIPIGIMGSLLMCTFLYIAVALVLTGLVPYTELAVPDPIALGVNAIGMDWLSFMVKVGAIAGLTSVMLVTMYGQTRIFYNVSKDGLLPPVFATIHEKFKTPYINTVLVGLLVATAAALTPISALGSLVSVGTLVAFAMVCFTVIYLRVKHPELERPFRCPGAPIVPALGILSCLALVAGQWQTLLTLKVYMGLGFLFYFLYGYRKSRLAKAQNASA